MNVNLSVIDRYTVGAKEGQAALCCALDYDCDDPSRNDFIDMPRQGGLSADYCSPISGCC